MILFFSSLQLDVHCISICTEKDGYTVVRNLVNRKIQEHSLPPSVHICRNLHFEHAPKFTVGLFLASLMVTSCYLFMYLYGGLKNFNVHLL